MKRWNEEGNRLLELWWSNIEKLTFQTPAFSSQDTPALNQHSRQNYFFEYKSKRPPPPLRKKKRVSLRLRFELRSPGFFPLQSKYVIIDLYFFFFFLIQLSDMFCLVMLLAAEKRGFPFARGVVCSECVSPVC